MIYPSFLESPSPQRDVRLKKWNNPETPPSSFFQIWYPIYILIKTWDLAPVSFIHLSGGGWWYREPPGCEIKKLYNWSSGCLTLIFITWLTSVQYFLYFLLPVWSVAWPGPGPAGSGDNWVMIVDKTLVVIMTPRSTTWLCVSRV